MKIRHLLLNAFLLLRAELHHSSEGRLASQVYSPPSAYLEKKDEEAQVSSWLRLTQD